MGGLCYIYLVLLDFFFFFKVEGIAAHLYAGLKEPVERGKLMIQGRMKLDPVPTLRGGLRQEGTVQSIITVEGEDAGAPGVGVWGMRMDFSPESFFLF